MANCINCKGYFRRSKYNQTDSCDDCLDDLEAWPDVEDEMDIYSVVNPTGKTPARIPED